MYTKDQILSVINRVYEDSRYVIFGEQCDFEEEPAITIKRYAEATGGHYPALIGIDLACYGLKLPQIGTGSELWNKYVDQLTEFAEAGGIVTASSHFANPTGNFTEAGLCRGVFGGEDEWEELLTEGTTLNTALKEELLIDAEFLRDLGKRGVTVLWRPLHEANGGWFWYGARSHRNMPWLDSKYLKRLWIYIHELYTKKLGLDNLLWVYAPNFSSNMPDGPRDVLFYYPGDEYVDIVGLDWYTGNYNEVVKNGHSADKMMTIKKPFAYTEFGPNASKKSPDFNRQVQLFNATDMVKIMKDMTNRGFKIAYCMTWRGGHGAIYSIGKGDEAVKDPFFIDRDRLRSLYRS